jgi:predicted glycoside hydrolase/deacetylase ChbG (UPF0249 family)
LQLAKEYGCGVRLPNPIDITEVSLRSALPTDSTDFVRNDAVRALDDLAIPYPDFFIAGFFASGVSLDHLLKIIDSLPDGVSELMCHPGIVDDELSSTSGYAKLRELELHILTSPELIQAVEQSGVTLITFQQAFA